VELLRELSELHGVPGREEEVREFIRSKVEGLVDEIEVDPLGNLICRKHPSGGSDERVMVACHMDEIGFYVRAIDKRGFLRLHPVGGFDPRNLFARRVVVKTRSGKLVGTLNPQVPPVHLSTEGERRKVPQLKDFYVDLGMSAEQVRALVQVGDPVTLAQSFAQVGELWSGKAMDNRAACWVGIRLLESLEGLTRELAVVFTTQEEVGLRGAMTSAFRVGPDIAIAVDVTLAYDTPGVDEDDRIASLGKGVCIKIADSASISDRELVDHFIQLAERNEIDYQVEVLPRGGTDAGAMQRIRGGAKTITLSIPTRYIHTVVECIHPDDLRGCLALLKAYLES